MTQPHPDLQNGPHNVPAPAGDLWAPAHRGAPDHGERPRLSSGIPTLDAFLGGGFLPGTLVDVSAFAFLGAWVLALALRTIAAANRAGQRVIWIDGDGSADMAPWQIDPALTRRVHPTSILQLREWLDEATWNPGDREAALVVLTGVDDVADREIEEALDRSRATTPERDLLRAARKVLEHETEDIAGTLARALRNAVTSTLRRGATVLAAGTRPAPAAVDDSSAVALAASRFAPNALAYYATTRVQLVPFGVPRESVRAHVVKNRGGLLGSVSLEAELPEPPGSAAP